jgi:mannan endo-1,4-beta-mannosidase
MNEPRYQNATPNENSTGTTLRAWVDTMGAYIKSIDPNHMVDAGLEGHGTKYGFGGDEGNPFVYIQESPYIDFTSAHPYPTESWANLTLAQTESLIDQWVSDSHNVVGKPFFMGEYNVFGVDRSTWWSGMQGEIEKDNADGDAFWWYETNNTDGQYGVMQGAAELSVFDQHSLNMQAKNVPVNGSPQPSPTPITPTPTRGVTPTPTRGVTPTPTVIATATPTQGVTPTPTATSVSGGVHLTYQVSSQWSGGFTANIAITNNGSTAINGWTLKFTFPGTQQITQLWNGQFTQSGNQVTITNLGYNGTIAPGSSVSFGFNGSWSGSNPNPTSFTLNGAAASLN